MNWTAIGTGAQCECPNGTICLRPSKYSKPILCVNPELAQDFPDSLVKSTINNNIQHADITLLAMTLIIILIQVKGRDDKNMDLRILIGKWTPLLTKRNPNLS